LREVFQDLFHPSESGSLSDFIARGWFKVLRPFPSLLSDAAPLAIITNTAAWAVLVALGFTLVYWPWFPEGFTLQNQGSPTGFWSVCYYSCEVLTTLGFGDYPPKFAGLRFLSIFEAATGFGLLTAGVSSILLIQPALGRIRALARAVGVFCRASERCELPLWQPGKGDRLDIFAIALARSRVDIVHSPILFYFYSRNDDASLPAALLRLEEICADAMKDENHDIRARATALRLSLEELAELLGRRLPHQARGQDVHCMLEAFAEKHTPGNGGKKVSKQAASSFGWGQRASDWRDG
jgi:hypothetical protein